MRGDGYFREQRLLVRFPEQLLDGVALRAQIQAPHPPHRTPRHRDQRGSGFRRQPESAADEPDALAAGTDHALKDVGPVTARSTIPGLRWPQPCFALCPLEGGSMTLYMYQASYTAKSMAAQLTDPHDPMEAITPTLADVGATIVVAGFPFGEYDLLLVY